MPRLHRAKEGDKIPISDYNLKADYLEAILNLKVTGGKFFIDRGGASLDIDIGAQTQIRWAKLLDDLEAAEEDSDDPPPTVEAVFLVTPASGEGRLVETEDTNPFTITNRWTDYTATQDDVVLVCRVNLDKSLEWTPLPFRFATTDTDTPTDGLPPDSEGCDCGNCLQGETIHDGLQCCVSHLRWSMKNPWLACAATDLVLEYIGNDEWLTDPFLGPDCDGFQNIYRWHMTIDVGTGRSYIELVLEEDNGCEEVCAIYGRDSFDCQCDNQFSILKPFGKWGGISRRDLSCYACIKPSREAEEIPELDLTLSPVGCGWHDCAENADVNDTIDLANQLILQQSDFEGHWCTGFSDQEAAFKFSNRSDPCNPAETKTFFIDADVNGLWLLNRGSGPWNALPVGRYSYRLEALADTACVGWGGTKIVGHFGTVSCEPVAITANAKVALLRQGCDYWFEGITEYPQYSTGRGRVIWYSDVGTFSIGAGDTLQDIVDWFNSSHTLTLYSSAPTCIDGSDCDCGDPDYTTPTTGTGTLATSATFLDLPPIDPQSPSDTGVCNETCSIEATPPDPDAGTCCFEGFCYDYWDEALCNDFGGIWNTDECVGCEAHTSCCIVGICLSISPYQCSLLGGVDSGDGGCDPNPCEEGACCRAATGTCEVVQEADCVGPDYFAGANTDCDDSPCPEGACCSKDNDGHNCECIDGVNDDYTYSECQTATGGAGQWVPGVSCSVAEAAYGICGETMSSNCEFGVV